MGSSPFANYEEYYNATGAIYTFADRPALIGILTVLSALIFIYFIYATYTMKQGDSGASMKGLIGLLLAASILPITDAVYNQYIQRSHHRPVASDAQSEPLSRRIQPMALLGLLGVGTTLSRDSRHLRRRSRRIARKQPSDRH